MKEAVRSLAHIAMITALTFIVVIAVVVLLVATGCSELTRDDSPAIVDHNGDELERTTISVPMPLTGQTLDAQFRSSVRNPDQLLGSPMFAVNIDYPTYRTSIHEWHNGHARVPQCWPENNSVHPELVEGSPDEWRFFPTIEQALYFARQTNLEIAHCQHCRPNA